MKRLSLLTSIVAIMCCSVQYSFAQHSNLQNGKYQNPIIHADYSDPDLVRVGDDYWMTSSSFNCVPALQILHSTDLVNWELAGSVFTQQQPQELFDAPAHGNGV